MRILEWFCVLLGAAWILACVAVPVGMLWIVCHFVAKYW